MLTVHRPPIYGYEPTTSVGVRFKVFCQNYEHLRGSGGVLVPSSGVGALWRGGAPTPPSPPDLSVTVWVRKKRWKDRLDRCGAGFPVPLGKSEAQGGSLAC